MKVFNKLDEIYRESRLGFAKKSKILVILLSIFMVMMAFFTIFDFIKSNYTDAVCEFLIFVISVVSIVFLYKGKYKIASSLSAGAGLILLSIMIIFGTFVDESGSIVWKAPDSIESILLYFLYITPVFSMLYLTGYAKWQPIFSAVTSMVFTLVIYFIFLSVNPEAASSDNSVVILITALAIEFVANLFAYMTMKLTNDIISNLETQLVINNDRISKMHSLLMKAHKGLSMGKDLSSSSQHSVALIYKTNDELKRMHSVIVELGEISRESSRILNDIKNAGDNVEQNMNEQSITVSESSASIEEMTASIQSIAKSAEQKSSIVDDVSNEAVRSADDLSNALTAIEEISKSSEGLLNVVGVIEDIAGRTNLLAMNASIEAAHAGSAGKGFAVVASEIRNLAEEANQNSKKIRKILDDNIDNIKHTSEISRTALVNLGSVTSDIKQVSSVIREVLDGARELSSAAGVVNQNSADLVKITNEVNQSIGEVNNLIETNFKIIDRLRKSSGDAEKSVGNINKDSQSLLNEINKVNKLGRDNVKNIQGLEEALDIG
jgi:methyl-accepting chemotaxis protein